MAVTGNSSAKRTTRWDVLVTNLKPDLPGIPHVTDDLKKLEDMLAEARALETQREDLRSQTQKATGQLKQLLRDGDKLRTRLGSNLKGKFGSSDETLVKYGFRARSTVVRRRKKEEPPAQPEMPQAPQQGTPAQGTSGAPAAGAK